jgi:hypothetical protein
MSCHVFVSEVSILPLSTGFFYWILEISRQGGYFCLVFYFIVSFHVSLAEQTRVTYFPLVIRYIILIDF